MERYIKIRGARAHNLKNINVDIPRDKLVVITGLSGSGKSSLAFDTIYAEGQRRYVESLSSYARQFLGQMDKPDVDQIDGGHNGDNYMAYTYYVRNAGKEDVYYNASITLDSCATTHARPSARSPRSTTTSDCSSRASAIRTVRSAASPSRSSRSTR